MCREVVISLLAAWCVPVNLGKLSLINITYDSVQHTNARQIWRCLAKMLKIGFFCEKKTLTPMDLQRGDNWLKYALSNHHFLR